MHDSAKPAQLDFRVELVEEIINFITMKISPMRSFIYYPLSSTLVERIQRRLIILVYEYKY